MPITASDIVIYGSQTMPENDGTLNIGGAIDLTTLIVFVDIDTPGTIEVVSDDNSDNTQQLTATGRNIGGSIISESVTLNGTTPVPLSNTYERFMKFELDGATLGNVTVRKSGNAGDLAVFLIGTTTIRQPFYLASADVSGGSSREYHEKIFVRNDHPTLDLTEAQILEISDPGANVTFALESVLDGSDTNGAGNNRFVAPGGYTFDSSAKNVANSQNHTSQSAQGVWLKLTLAAGSAPAKNTYTIRETGKTI